MVSDDLSTEPMRTDKPMRMGMSVNTNPKHVITARRAPPQYADASKSVIKDLIHKKVITRVEKPTECCSPAFFVPKGNGKVRLVTDFTELNKYVKRPTHQFPSMRDSQQAIPSNPMIFAKSDAVHGYF